MFSFAKKIFQQENMFSGGEVINNKHPTKAHHRRATASQQVLRGEEGVRQGGDAGEAGGLPGQGRVRHQPLQVRWLSHWLRVLPFKRWLHHGEYAGIDNTIISEMQ